MISQYVVSNAGDFTSANNVRQEFYGRFEEFFVKSSWYGAIS